MVEELLWSDSEDIGLKLFEQSPDTDPLTVRFTDLRDRICSLDAFKDDPEACSEGKLEAIQMAWLEEYQEEQG